MAYSLSTHLSGVRLLDNFSFFTGKDPAGGFVDWQSREDAMAKKLVSIDEVNRVKLGVDSVNAYSVNGTGRPSVKITSNDVYNHGLFITDFAHVPGSTCGTWPLFVALNGQRNGTRWPSGGEIDILEGANTAQRNLYSAHTTPGCRGPNEGFSGAQGFADCSLNPGDIGCNFAAPPSDTASYGDAFNAEGGGIFALEWDSSGIRVWHFPRSAVPIDISLAPLITPDPMSWGPPQAIFGGSTCDTDKYFYNMSLSFSTNFCGAYAGNTWGVADECDLLAPTCNEYVAGHPSTFNNAFWKINYIDVYQKSSGSGPESNNNNNNGTTVPEDDSAVSSTANDVVVLPTATRTITISTSVPTPTGGLCAPAAIDEWALLGCFGPLGLSGHETFEKQAATSGEMMDNKACVARCRGRRYAGVSGDTCYCADTLGRTTAVENGLCDVPCPGNASDMCGGVLTADERATSPSFVGMGISNGTTTETDGTATNNNGFETLTKTSTSTGIQSPPSSSSSSLPSRLRATNNNLSPVRVPVPVPVEQDILLTVYGNTNANTNTTLAAAAAAFSNSSDSSSSSLSPFDIPAYAPGIFGGGKGEITTVSNVVTVTYTTICCGSAASSASRLETLEYSTLLTERVLLRDLPLPSSSLSLVSNANASASSFFPTRTNPPRVFKLSATVPMTTLTQTCASCGVNGSSVVTLTVPKAVIEAETRGGGGSAVLVAIETVVPLPLPDSGGNGGTYASNRNQNQNSNLANGNGNAASTGPGPATATRTAMESPGTAIPISSSSSSSSSGSGSGSSSVLGMYMFAFAPVWFWFWVLI